MAAITFPNNPSADEQHTINGITYTFTDGTWVAVGQSNFYSLPIASPTTLGGIKGGGTDIDVANDGVVSFSGTMPGPKTFTFTVTGNGKTTVVDPQTGLSGSVGDYTITGSDRRGIVSGTNPTIHINEEDSIVFNVTAAGQPFRLMWATGPYSQQWGWDEIGTNSTNNNTATNQGTESGTVTWTSMEGDGHSLYVGGAHHFYQDCDQNWTNNPTTTRWGTILVFHKDTPEGKSDWLELNDTPTSYDGQAGKFTKVTANEDGLEFTDSTIQIASTTVLGGVKSGGTGIQIAADGVISIATGSTFDTNDVDTHINKSSANPNEVLSWNGTDYAWVGNAGYSNTDVDSHLNQSNPTSGHVLSWNGSDYAWINAHNLSVNTQGAAYQLASSDAGKMIKASGDITIGSSNTFQEGQCITIYNNTAGDINLTRSGTTLYLVGDNTDKDRVLAQKGIATIVCVGSNEYVVMGGGIT